MARVTPAPIASFSNSAIQTINQNFDAIAKALEDTLSRTQASPNHMQNDVDLNLNDLINVKTIDANRVFVGGHDLLAVLAGLSIGNEGIPPVGFDLIKAYEDGFGGITPEPPENSLLFVESYEQGKD